jgi:hypothetical protein
MSSGAGGEYFRDYYIHDFLHYGSSKVDFDRYYKIRMMTVTPRPEYFTSQAGEMFRAACGEVRRRMESQRAATNSESYARVSYFMKVPRSFGGFFSAYIKLGLDVRVLPAPSAPGLDLLPEDGELLFVRHARHPACRVRRRP